MQSILALSGKVESRLLRLSFTEQWVIGIRRTPDLHLPTRLMISSLLLPPAGTHFADPFIISRDGKTHVYFEAWRNADSTGSIWLTVLDAHGTWSQPEQVLKRPYHMSYPFIFSWRGELYMLPETQHNHTIELYRCVTFPSTWELASVLMEGVDAVDSTLFEDSGRWWMFATGFGDTSTRLRRLSIFVASSPFGPWRAHRQNPVLDNLGSARSAGRLFWHNGRLIRPGQDCRLRYGHSIAWNRIDILSCSEYRETCIGRLKPLLWDGWTAAHTFNQVGGWQVFDGKRLARKASTSRNV